jgi:ferredoxin
MKNYLLMVMIFIEYAIPNDYLLTHNSYMISDSQLSKLKGTLRKPHVNSTCIGCSACTAISGEVFELNDDGISCVKSISSYEGMDVDDSISACPVNAISWQEANELWEYTNGVIEHHDVP